MATSKEAVNHKSIFNLFVLTLLAGLPIVSSAFAVKVFVMLMWSMTPATPKADQAIVSASLTAVAGVAVLNMVISCLSWRWEGQGNPGKGIKALGGLLIGEFLVLVVIPVTLKLMAPF